VCITAIIAAMCSRFFKLPCHTAPSYPADFCKTRPLLCTTGAVCITAIIAATFCWSHKRRLHLQQQQQRKLKRPPSSSPGSKAAVASMPSGGVASSGYDEELGEAVGVDVDALRMFDRCVCVRE
jgi:hypothetical protein